MSGIEEISVGDGDKLSVTITRKTKGDLVVSQWTCQRWFPTPEECVQTLELVIQDMAALVNGRRSEASS